MIINQGTKSIDRARAGSIPPLVCHGVGGVILAFVVASCGEPPPPLGTSRDPLSSAVPTGARPGAITLVTGDRVTLATINGRTTPQIEPGPGRDSVEFLIEEHDGEVTVVPADAAALVGSGRLDPALFNVTRLIADGYGDDRRGDLPLIITGQSNLPASSGLMANAGVTVDRALPTLHMMAVRQRKSSGGAVLANLAPAPAGFAGARPPQIWLDARRKLMLDRSVPQVGAPAAYARGWTGAGVVVAVLDTGIDASHPDLTGKVTAAESFIDDGLGTSDVVGHATHVASIIAGTGAASGGRFHGVAPGATLVSGRVCNDLGCPISAILAGMEWAVVSQHARIVNLSLGGQDSPSIDPLEDAVNQLSAEHGTLFVIAAGNGGFSSETIASPGSADAALTVGAVDRNDQRAVFSGQGPRIGDHAVKPDLTAPGLGIVAARAAGTTIGTPVGASYVELSGTSMATPHVAGAAAILLQQHPDWTGAQLKAALVGSASPNPTLSVYEQGAGRLDVDRATGQPVTGEPASLSLGTARFPHDDDQVITRTVRYHNAGAAPVVLTLDATLTAPGGAPAPAGMVAVTPRAITVPAGGSAEVVVNVDTRVDARDGVYGGTLTATGDGVRVVTPLGVEREPASFELTIHAVGRDGRPAQATVFLVGIGDVGEPNHNVVIFQALPGQGTFRLPRGTYAVVMDDFSDDPAMIVAPRVELVRDADLIMDGRAARPVDVTVPDAGLIVTHQVTSFLDVVHGVGAFRSSRGSLATLELGPSAPPGEIQSTVSVILVPAGQQSPTIVYNLAHHEPDHFPTGWKQTLQRHELATVRASHAGAEDQAFQKNTAAISADSFAFILNDGFRYTGSFRRTEYYYGPGFAWFVALTPGIPDLQFPEFLQAVASWDALRDYRPGQLYLESWGQAPFGPAFSGPSAFSFLPDRTNTPMRFGDDLVVAPSMFSDQSIPARNGTSTLEHRRLTLRRDGKVFAETDDPFDDSFLDLLVPPAPSQYRFEQEVTRSSELFELSTRVAAAWTFRSQHADVAGQALSLPTLRFLPALDEHNQTAARVLVLPIRIERPVGAATPRIAHAQVEASFDDGATWSRVPIALLGDRALGLVVHPRGASHVSLRGAAADVDGNEVEQTIIRAYGLARR